MCELLSLVSLYEENKHKVIVMLLQPLYQGNYERIYTSSYYQVSGKSGKRFQRTKTLPVATHIQNNCRMSETEIHMIMKQNFFRSLLLRVRYFNVISKVSHYDALVISLHVKVNYYILTSVKH